MKVYITVIPEKGDIRALAPTRDSAESQHLGAILTFTSVMMNEEIPTRLVITNMKRDRASEFQRASEM